MTIEFVEYLKAPYFKNRRECRQAIRKMEQLEKEHKRVSVSDDHKEYATRLEQAIQFLKRGIADYEKRLYDSDEPCCCTFHMLHKHKDEE